MKIWQAWGSEHSYRLVMIGKFEDVKTAEQAARIMTRLQEFAPELIDQDWETPGERYPDGLHSLLEELKVWDMTRDEVEGMGYDFSISRDGDQIEITGSDISIQGFVKLIINKGGRVEIFSRHNETAEPEPAEELTAEDGPAEPAVDQGDQ